MKTSLLVGILVVLLSTGTLNTILSKSQDHTCVGDCDNKLIEKCYVQPGWQAIVMFLGEILCLFAYVTMKHMHKKQIRSKNLQVPLESSTPTTLETLLDETSDSTRLPMKGKSHLLMWIPACCDIFGTSVMMLSLTYLSGSIFQMLRGAVVIFTALASVFFLKNKLPLYKWTSLGIIAFGLLLVGLFPGGSKKFGACGEEHPASEKNGMMIGVALVILSQLFTACQFVAEEKIMKKYKLPPIKAVGLEGIFGFSTALVLLLFMNFTLANNENYSEKTRRMFDFKQGLHETFFYSTPLTLMSIGSIFAIAFFNFCGLSITKALSSTARSTLDMCRTLFVWLFTLIAGWESFFWVQLIGFGILVYGTFLFNGVVKPPSFLLSSSTVHVNIDDIDEDEIEHKKDESNETNVTNDVSQLILQKDPMDNSTLYNSDVHTKVVV